ncbi:hypothetical protein X777_03881, partial [Ooceraea biroi]
GRRVENECLEELWTRPDVIEDDIFHLRNLYGEDEWAPENWDDWNIEPIVANKTSKCEEEEEEDLLEGFKKKWRIDEDEDSDIEIIFDKKRARGDDDDDDVVFLYAKRVRFVEEEERDDEESEDEGLDEESEEEEDDDEIQIALVAEGKEE